MLVSGRRTLPCALVTQLLLGVPAWAAAPQRVKVGEVKALERGSPHPYAVPSEGERQIAWSDIVLSPGAAFVRVHFKRLELAPGDFVTVSSADGRQRWTYPSGGPHGSGAFWSFAVEGDRAIVDLHGSVGGTHFGYEIDQVGRGTVPLSGGAAGAACGEDAREDAACHPELDALTRPVARLLFVSGSAQYVCTGALVAGSAVNTLLTTSHCLATEAEVRSVQATFNHQRATCGAGPLAAPGSYAGEALLRTSSPARKGKTGGLDYTLLTLQGNAETAWGELTPSARARRVGEALLLPQHPAGTPKQVARWQDAAHTSACTVSAVGAAEGQTASGSQTTYGCSVGGGASGSPLLAAEGGALVGLHRASGVSRTACLHAATAMGAICEDAGGLLQCETDAASTAQTQE